MSYFLIFRIAIYKVFNDDSVKQIIIFTAIMIIIFFSKTDQLISLKIPTSRALNVVIPPDTNE